ncbi:unnamed protein product [Clonostachys rosea]|uniref:FAD-binding PCMH-type domain-containing protein n=1 Tax=Bionectria ochroleuca TaxID=29856 RepID=A0ABY6U6Z6_BIOOC|nr:unnamed protein product [Clonostachys rosea]
MFSYPSQRPMRGTAVALLSLMLLLSVSQAAKVGLPPCDALLESDVANRTHLPTSPIYNELVNGTWSPSVRKRSWCYVLPTSAEEVSQTITAIHSAGAGAGDWAVAIRSGGHGSDNSNNIEEGVTIDLSQLNSTTYHAESKTASIGPGGRWMSVYKELQKHGVAVTGGREGIVGVGGLILGGGVSWYSARQGLACDGVVNFEIVLASGEIVNANASSNADLWKALKGGSSNFGIVTRFDLETFPVTNLAIQRRRVSIDHAKEVVDAIVGFTNLDRSQAENAFIAVTQYDPKSQTSSIQLTEVNTMNNPNSSAYTAFRTIPTIPNTGIEIVSQSLPQSANRSQINAPDQSAGAGALTLINDPRVLNYCFEQYQQLVKDLSTLIGPQSFSTIFDLQPFPGYLGIISNEKGGNMLGLDRDSRNKVLFIASVIPVGPQAEVNARPAYQLVSEMNTRVEAFANSINANAVLRYLPYANSRQDVLGSYGFHNSEFMRAAADKYDPYGFFQKMVPGGFKISRVGRI